MIRNFAVRAIVEPAVRLASRHPLPIIVLTLLLTVGAGMAALRVQIQPSLERLLPRDSAIAQLMDEHRQNREERDWLIVLVEGDGLFAPPSLAAFRRAIGQIEQRPEVTATIDPFRFIGFSAENGPLRLTLMAPDGEAPVTEAAAQAFRERLSADPQARNLVVSSDGDALGVLFNVPLRGEYYGLLDAVASAVRPLRDLGLTVSLAGLPTIDTATLDRLTADLPILLGLSILVIMATYYVGFRSLRATILPVIVVGIATIWTIATMTLLGLDFTIVSVTTPPFVMTLGSAYSVHVLSAYLLGTPAGKPAPGRVPAGIAGVSATVILAALTTMAGFSSLTTASVAAVREFGVITGAGIFYCALLALLFLPACVRLVKVPARRTGERTEVRALAALGRAVLRHRRIIVTTVPIALVGFSVAAIGLEYETEFTRFFRGGEGQRVMDTNLHVQRRLGGFVDFNVTISAPQSAEQGGAGYFLDPQMLRTVATFEERMRALPGVSWTHSFVSELQRMNQALSGASEVPESRAAVMLLARYFEALRDTPGRTMVPPPLEADGTRLHINARVFDVEQDSFFLEGRFRTFLTEVEQLATESLPAELNVRIWSGSVAALHLQEVLVRDHLQSIAVSVLLVFLVTAAGFRSFVLAAFSILPMALGILVIFAYLSVTGTKLDTLTMTFSSVAVGAGVDYAVHVIVGFVSRTERAGGGGVRGGAAGSLSRERVLEVIVATLSTSGRAILLSAVSLSAGLLVLSLSSLVPVVRLGVLLSVSIVAAAVASLVVLPALLSLRHPPIRSAPPTAAAPAG